MSSDKQPLLLSTKTDIDEDERETDQQLSIKKYDEIHKIFLSK